VRSATVLLEVRDVEATREAAANGPWVRRVLDTRGRESTLRLREMGMRGRECHRCLRSSAFIDVDVCKTNVRVYPKKSKLTK
jgi:hypothetical protein